MTNKDRKLYWQRKQKLTAGNKVSNLDTCNMATQQDIHKHMYHGNFVSDFLIYTYILLIYTNYLCLYLFHRLFQAFRAQISEIMNINTETFVLKTLVGTFSIAHLKLNKSLLFKYLMVYSPRVIRKIKRTSKQPPPCSPPPVQSTDNLVFC